MKEPEGRFFWIGISIQLNTNVLAAHRIDEYHLLLLNVSISLKGLCERAAKMFFCVGIHTNCPFGLYEYDILGNKVSEM